MPENPTTGELRFATWPTERSIFEAHSNEAIQYLVPIVGPSAGVLLHHVGGHLTQTPMPSYTTMAKLSHACGGGPQGGRQSIIARALHRLVFFDLALHDGPGRYLIRVKVPPLTAGRSPTCPWSSSEPSPSGDRHGGPLGPREGHHRPNPASQRPVERRYGLGWYHRCGRTASHHTVLDDQPSAALGAADWSVALTGCLAVVVVERQGGIGHAGFGVWPMAG